LIEKIKKWAKEPLLHFLIIGAGAYALSGLLAGGGSQDNERAIVVSASDMNALVDQWQRAWMRPPTEDELAHLVRSHVRVKVLYKEALAMGLDAGDKAIEQRLAQKVEMLARNLSTPAEPTEEVLRTWYSENSNAFKQPDLYSIAHVFFDPERRKDATQNDARAALEQLNALSEVPSDFADYGDSSTQQNYLAQYGELELRRVFGSQLVDEIVKLQPGRWHGPFPSGYGTHLLWVNEVVRFPAPGFEEVRGQAAEQWMAEQIDEMSERYVDELASRYEVVVETRQLPAATAGEGATP